MNIFAVEWIVKKPKQLQLMTLLPMQRLQYQCVCVESVLFGSEFQLWRMIKW